ncbi:MAG: class I SAM-dependent methyltransferase [Nanoarchaeota archaeon]|nr:class I SAM-dependent methyltransferase [Nanoarchaeota archaeon]
MRQEPDISPEYWDTVASRMDGRQHIQEDVARYKRKEHICLLERWVPEERRGTVLKTDLFEEAFGHDFYYDYLANSYKRAVAIDISGQIVRKAKERFNGEFYTCGIQRTGFKARMFDVIISGSTLDHLSYEEMIKAVYEMKRILKRDGILIITIDNKENTLYRIGYSIGMWLRLSPYKNVSCYSYNEMAPIFAGAGLKVEGVTSIVSLPTPFNLVAKVCSKINLLSGLNKNMISFFHSRLSGRRDTGWFLCFRLAAC